MTIATHSFVGPGVDGIEGLVLFAGFATDAAKGWPAGDVAKPWSNPQSFLVKRLDLMHVDGTFVVAALDAA